MVVSSWTTGAFLLLHALGIVPGGEVLVPSLTFIASVNVIAHAGASPVFVDVDPESWNICPVDAARKITSRTKAIIPVDQIGLPCEIGEIQALAARHNLIVIQDAACSFWSRIDGRPIGAMNDLSVFSLHARKVVTTGEGGIITTHDSKMADRLRMLRHQGMSLSDFARHNSKPTVFGPMREWIASGHPIAKVLQVRDSLELREADVIAGDGRCLQFTYGYLVAARRRSEGVVDAPGVIRGALQRNATGSVLVSARTREHLTQLAAVAA